MSERAAYADLDKQAIAEEVRKLLPKRSAPVLHPACEGAASQIYFVSFVGGGPIKLGVARDVYARLAHLQSAHFLELEILAAMPGSYPEERRLIDLLGLENIRGEWFVRSGWFDRILEGIRAEEDVDAILKRLEASSI